MSGKVPPSSRAGKYRGRESADDIEAAKRLYEQFTGHAGEIIGKARAKPMPRAVCVIGTLDAVEYTCVRDGVVERYRHRFATKDRGILASSPDGRQLLIFGGHYDFTELGIVDGSDKKTRKTL